MNMNFKEVMDISPAKFADCSLGKKLDSKIFNLSPEIADQPLAIMYDRCKNCPIENGSWTGERGESKWNPDREYVPLKANPNERTWGDILRQYKINGIVFEDGEPDFSEIDKGTVEIKSFSDSRDDNFEKADIELASLRGCLPSEVKKWRKENGYTWHECRDMKTMLKVPGIVHNNISHSGGISEAKKGA